jgi:hypothetical protein
MGAFDFSRYSTLTPDQRSFVQQIADRPMRLNAQGHAAGFEDENLRAAQGEASRLEQGNRSRAGHNRLVRVGQVASAVPLGFALAPGGALSGMYTGGTAAAGAPAAASLPAEATAGIGFSAAPAATVAPAAGRFATLGKIFNSPGAELGINAGLSLYGQSQANRAARDARADALAANREALALQRQQIEAEIENSRLDRADAKAANDALNELRRRELDAAEEERAYNRSKDEAYETRMQPYRDVSAAAMRKLQGMWGLA